MLVAHVRQAAIVLSSSETVKNKQEYTPVMPFLLPRQLVAALFFPPLSL